MKNTRNRYVMHAALALLFGACVKLSAASYYCDPATGNINNSGSSTSPWSTLQEVFSNNKTFSSGDIIYLRNGSHGNPVVTTANAGNVTIRKQSGHDPVIGRIKFDGASKWTVDGVRIHTAGATPSPNGLVHPVAIVFDNGLVRIENSSSDIKIVNCTLYSVLDSSGWSSTDWNDNAWNGVHARNSTNITVESCTLRNINFAVAFTGSGSGATVKNCLIENFIGDGIRLNHDDALVEYNVIREPYATNGNHRDGIQSDGGSINVTIRGNFIVGARTNRSLQGYYQGIFAGGSTYENWRVENNLVAVDGGNGIYLSAAVDCEIVNNTVVRNPIYVDQYAPSLRVLGASTGNVIRNNLVRDLDIVAGAGTQSNNIESASYTSHFVDYDGFNFHLRSTSSAVGAGTTTDAPTIDLDKITRSASYDIGAYEYKAFDPLEPVADSFTYGGSVNQNNGTNVRLAAKDGSGTSFDRRAYLKFDLSSLPFAPTTATLVMECDSLTQAGTVATRSVSDDTWTETGVTWQNQPSMGGTNLSSTSVSAGQTTDISLSVSAFIQQEHAGDKIATIALTGDDAVLYFKSRENSAGSRPTLVFTTP